MRDFYAGVVKDFYDGLLCRTFMWELCGSCAGVVRDEPPPRKSPLPSAVFEVHPRPINTGTNDQQNDLKTVKECFLFI